MAFKKLLNVCCAAVRRELNVAQNKFSLVTFSLIFPLFSNNHCAKVKSWTGEMVLRISRGEGLTGRESILQRGSWNGFLCLSSLGFRGLPERRQCVILVSLRYISDLWDQDAILFVTVVVSMLVTRNMCSGVTWRRECLCPLFSPVTQSVGVRDEFTIYL